MYPNHEDSESNGGLPLNSTPSNHCRYKQGGLGHIMCAVGHFV